MVSGPVPDRVTTSCTSTSSNPGNTVTADTPVSYLHGYSEATDPTGLITATTFAPANGTGTCGGSTVTLAAGNRCQLNLTITTRVSQASPTTRPTHPSST